MRTSPAPPESGLGESGSGDRIVRMRHGESRRPAVLKAPADVQLPHLYGASGPFVAGGQRVDVGIVEESVVAVPPRVGL